MQQKRTLFVNTWERFCFSVDYSGRVMGIIASAKNTQAAIVYFRQLNYVMFSGRYADGSWYDERN